MSAENIMRFREELKTNDELKEKLEGLKLNYENFEELISFAREAGFEFTLEELMEVNSKPVTEELSNEQLDKVVGGLATESGCWYTTVCFTCRDWCPAIGRLWLAVKGQCGSCFYWDARGYEYAVYFGAPGICWNDNNRISEEY